MKWYVTSNEDIADPYIIIRDTSNPGEVVYETTLPYFRRSLEIDTKGKLGDDIEHAGGGVQICLLAKDSKTDVRAWHGKQCKEIPKQAALTSASSPLHGNIIVFVMILAVKWLVQLN